MIGLHISDLFWRSLVVDPEDDDTALDTEDGVADLDAKLAVITVLVVAETGVFEVDGVLLAGVFCKPALLLLLLLSLKKF